MRHRLILEDLRFDKKLRVQSISEGWLTTASVVHTRAGQTEQAGGHCLALCG